MAKKNGKNQPPGGKTHIVTLFVEGDTEVEFYSRLLAWLRETRGRSDCVIEIKNVKGVGNYQGKVTRQFVNAIKVRHPGCGYTVILCYDSDAFEYSSKPPVNWEKVTTSLKAAGADAVEQVVAIHSIEDWFLYDMEGLRSFLKIAKKTRLDHYKGQKGLEQLFLKANRTYIKGVRCSGLVDALHMETIVPHIQDEIKAICVAIGIDASDCVNDLNGS